MRHQLLGAETVYKGFVELLRARFRAGDEEIVREVEHHGDAVAVLPYDPARKVALLVSLSRAPAIVAGVTEPFLEAPAGMIEDGDAAATAKRELIEETGLRVCDVEPVGFVWSSPGVSTERMHLFLAAYSPADRIGEGGGVAGEHEDITVTEMRLSALGKALDSGGIADMKTLALLLLLRGRRSDLFA